MLKMELFEYQDLREKEKRRIMDKQKDDQNKLLVLIVLLLIIFAIFITSRYRFTRKQSQLISTQRQQLQDRQKELIRANAELEIALNHKAVFLSNMSHEIRTPLNAIVGMSNLAAKEDMAEVAQKYLRNIVTASSNLIDIVNDILDFSKLEAGKLEIVQEPFSVADALEVAENVMRIPAEQKGLFFEVEGDSSLPQYLEGDASRLNQVLINLVGNAIKFTLDGGVTMKASVGSLPPLPKWCPTPSVQHSDWFIVRVVDTGIGIPADKLEKIFESFNQGDQLKTRKFGGTGLGLSISKQIVELQGGVIWVESVDGEGSTFAFALPALASSGGVNAEEAVSDDTEIGPLRILIAEDNPFNVIVTEDTLRSELKEVEIGKAENGRIAFEKVRDEEWDLVLMDIHMPEMSGLEATTAIRKLSNSKSETLIVAMTASVLREETDSYIRHGMNGFVPKPFQVEQLLSEIRRLKKETKQPPKKAPVTLPALRILIAEDNPFNVIVAEDTLRSEIPNVTIGKAVNGKEAFEAVRDGEWDLVLMDIAMPEMTGLEATSAIRKLPDPEKSSTTIIAMTASVLKEETDHYLQKGMDGFVPKPFKLEQLLGEIQRAHLSNT
jgi:signal transduction histidine kinase/DNA-binding NarL/FixJ family response regulator